MTWRVDFERRSQGWLTRLSRLPHWAVVIMVVLVLLAGLLGPAPAGALTLAALALFLGWLLTLSWPALAIPARLLRLAVVAILVGVAAQRL